MNPRKIIDRIVIYLIGFVQGANEIFSSCGKNSCQNTCKRPNAALGCTSTACIPGCVCAPGFLRSTRHACVLPVQCNNANTGLTNGLTNGLLGIFQNFYICIFHQLYIIGFFNCNILILFNNNIYRGCLLYKFLLFFNMKIVSICSG